MITRKFLYLSLFFITASTLVFPSVCGEDGTPCMEGMAGCTTCNFRPPVPPPAWHNNLDPAQVTDTKLPNPTPGTPTTGPTAPIGPSGGGGGSVITDLHNDLSTPCLKKLLDEIIAKDMKNRMKNILNSFEENKQIDFDYVDGSPLPDHMLGYFNEKASTETRKQIELNKDKLPLASKELATIVIFHESIHASLNAEKMDGILHHGEMAIKYTGMLSQALTDMYGTPKALADVLAWEGLLTSDAWNLFKANKPQSEIDNMLKTLQDHEKAAAGTPFCK